LTLVLFVLGLGKYIDSSRVNMVVSCSCYISKQNRYLHLTRKNINGEKQVA
jgi:hypothetical protein